MHGSYNPAYNFCVVLVSFNADASKIAFFRLLFFLFLGMASLEETSHLAARASELSYAFARRFGVLIVKERLQHVCHYLLCQWLRYGFRAKTNNSLTLRSLPVLTIALLTMLGGNICMFTSSGKHAATKLLSILSAKWWVDSTLHNLLPLAYVLFCLNRSYFSQMQAVTCTTLLTWSILNVETNDCLANPKRTVVPRLKK